MIPQSYQDIITLISSFINKKEPSFDHELDYKEIYGFAKAHSLLSFVARSLENYPKFNEADERIKAAFKNANLTSVRKSLSFDAERESILKELDAQKISYVPLKGIILNRMYPEPGLREFADNDIYYDAKNLKKVKKIFLGRGYSGDSIGKGVHDSYKKKPFFNFEMHRMIFPKKEGFKNICSYFENINSLVVKDNENTDSFAYHFKDEDFYLHLIGHAFKHFDASGNGLRFPLDLYFFLSEKGDSLDWDFINGKLKDFSLLEFEEDIRALSFALFGDEKKELNGRQRDMLSYILGCGVYGNIDNSVNRWMKKHNHSKIGYIWHRLWLGWDVMKENYPFFIYTIIFIPLLLVYRAFKGIFSKRGRAEIKAMAKDKKE
ncbi:MAG: nucleotidyltransferase family protein [Bacilli bacterium]|nr:nucleotidyltransferase family protein [Bacilli bacterium]